MSRKEETKNNLLDAFWELYKKKPLAKITVKEITDRAGYNRGTFYSYFIDVNEALEILKASLMPDKDMIINPFVELKDNDGKIIEPIAGTNDYLKKNGEKIAVLLGPKGDPGFVHELKARLRQIIINYAEELEIKEVENFEYVIEYHIAGLISMYQLWLEKQQNIDDEALARVYEKTAYNGALSVVNQMLNDTK
ncbi:TetR/AcrR family transcriptional regulator [Salinicoccus sp. HZC-1]|uniref:TetR/AcrR family transcriptional regulator n=1 Tax=Salinicoccus sp. HZC-1 TaxID=3385497 RepID=UPI00398AEDB7